MTQPSSPKGKRYRIETEMKICAHDDAIDHDDQHTHITIELTTYTDSPDHNVARAEAIARLLKYMESCVATGSLSMDSMRIQGFEAQGDAEAPADMDDGIAKLISIAEENELDEAESQGTGESKAEADDLLNSLIDSRKATKQ